jgi:hypothetical protein
MEHCGQQSEMARTKDDDTDGCAEDGSMKGEKTKGGSEVVGVRL